LWLDALVYAMVGATVLSGADYFFGVRRSVLEARRRRAGAEPESA
jgi:CDP-diacylglycerol--glycerol-3-phosphate 3-phosphatidyltransferase